MIYYISQISLHGKDHILVEEGLVSQTLCGRAKRRLYNDDGQFSALEPALRMLRERGNACRHCLRLARYEERK